MFKGRSFVAIVVLVAFGFVVAGCGGGGEQADTGMESTAEPAATGSLTATVNFDGEAPEPEEYDASGNSECNVDTVEGQTVVVNDNGTLKNVVVAVKSGPDGLDKSAPDVSFTQKNCKYDPHVAVAKAGQSVTVGDEDPRLHNVRGSKDGSQLFNLQTFEGDSKEFSVDETGVVSLVCDVHPWMQGYLYVTEHGAAGVTNDSGEVTLDELPEGDYTLEIWHEEYGTQTEDVTISEDEESSLSVTFSP